VKARLAVTITVMLVAAIAGTRYVILSREATTPLSRFYVNGFCSYCRTSLLCSFYLQAPHDSLEMVGVHLDESNYTFNLPYGGLAFNNLVEGELYIDNSNLTLKLRSDGKSTAVIRLHHVKIGRSVDRYCTERSLLNYTTAIEPGTGKAIELGGLQVTNASTYLALITISGSCTVDMKLYAFQDVLAWEQLVTIEGRKTLILPLGGAVDKSGFGPIYTKLIVNNLEGTRCRVYMEVIEARTVTIHPRLIESGEIAASIPLICLNS
jgi:hypothetical protein